jgi:hypothetical protein
MYECLHVSMPFQADRRGKGYEAGFPILAFIKVFVGNPY